MNWNQFGAHFGGGQKVTFFGHFWPENGPFLAKNSIFEASSGAFALGSVPIIFPTSKLNIFGHLKAILPQFDAATIFFNHNAFVMREFEHFWTPKTARETCKPSCECANTSH